MVLSMDRWKGKIAIVTGACGGIGKSVVQHLLDEGLQVVRVDNRSDHFPQNQKGTLYTFKVDITQDREVLDLFQWTSDNLGPVHILVNCAGVCQETTLTDGDTSKWRKVFNVNVLGLSIMTREAAKMMKSNNIAGHIVHIGSLFGHVVLPLPQVNVYPASKFAVRALTETLRQEFCHLGLKIKITCISPAKVDTALLQNNDYSADSETARIFETLPMIQPSDVAEAVLYTLSTPPHVQVHDLVIAAR